MGKSVFSDSAEDIRALQERVEDELSKEFKKGNGVFFTPYRIIQKLMDLAEINVGDKIVDPSCAIGQFLGPIVDRLILKGKKQGLQDEELVKVITQDVYGTDINERFVKLCKKYLTEKIYRLSGLKAKFKISKKDFLSEDCETKFDVVIGNPPYGIPGYDPHYPIRFTREQKENYKKYFKTWKGKYNIYALFIEQGLNILKKGGRLSFIVPGTFMILNEFEKLRRYLSTIGKTEIEYLGNNVFKDAQVATVLLKVTKGEKGLILRSDNYCNEKEIYDGGLIRFEDEFTKELEKDAPCRLGDLFDIHISARSPEVANNPFVFKTQQGEQRRGWSSNKPETKGEDTKECLEEYLPVLNGRNLRPFKIDYKTDFSGYWIKADKVGTLRDYYLKKRIAVGHTKGGKIESAIEDKKYPWISDVYFLIPKNNLQLVGMPKAFAKETKDGWYIRCSECKTKIDLEECPTPGGMTANIETCYECGIDMAVYPPKSKSTQSAKKREHLSLEEVTYILNSPLSQKLMKTLYRDITPHTTLTQLKIFPVYPIDKWRELEEKYGKDKQN